MTKKVDWNIFSVNISGSLKYTALIAKLTYGSFKRDSGHPVLSCLELKKGNNLSEVIPSPKQFALMVSMCCRKHWSSWNMLINLLLTYLKCVSIIPNCTLKSPVSSRLVSRNISFCFSFLSPSHPNWIPLCANTNSGVNARHIKIQDIPEGTSCQLWAVYDPRKQLSIYLVMLDPTIRFSTK